MATAADFELLETIRWTPEEGFFLLDRHLNRLERSASYFTFSCSRTGIIEALESCVAPAQEPQRIRLLVARDGRIRTERTPLRLPTVPARLALARQPIDPHDVFLQHKTTNRETYERARLPEVDDVVLWNPARQVTESTIANIVAEVDRRLLTPPVSCGLLPGTMREQLLAERAIEAAVVTVDELQKAPRLWLINAVRGWWPAVLAGAGRKDGG